MAAQLDEGDKKDGGLIGFNIALGQIEFISSQASQAHLTFT
jgi:hypothetical protein